MANNENKTFRQYISPQFNKTPTKNITTNKLIKGKQADVLRILLLMPSKSVLAKLKFFKKN